MSNKDNSLVLDIHQEIGLEYDIKALEIENDFLAIKQKVFVDKQLFADQEYISTKELTKDIQFVHSHLKKPVIQTNTMPKLYNKQILDVVRRIPYYDVNFSDYEIEKPFSYIKENGKDNVVLLYCIDVEYKINDIYGNEIPLAVFFDGESNGLTDEIYNIRKVGYMLKHRSDVTFQFDMTKKEENIFRTIARREISKFHPPAIRYVEALVPFIWSPSDEDWKKYNAFCNDIKDLEGYKREFTDEYGFILSNIFGLDVAKREIANF